MRPYHHSPITHGLFLYLTAAHLFSMNACEATPNSEKSNMDKRLEIDSGIEKFEDVENEESEDKDANPSIDQIADKDTTIDNPVCEVPQNEKGQEVTIIVKNQRNSSVYLGDRRSGCSRTRDYYIFDHQGESVSVNRDFCFSCESIANGDTCPNYSCAMAYASELKAGEEVAFTWDGLYYIEKPLPTDCPQQLGDTSCEQAIRAEGDYKVLVKASLELNDDSLGSGEEVEATGNIALAESSIINLVFED